jgi:DNA-binding phage protein
MSDEKSTSFVLADHLDTGFDPANYLDTEEARGAYLVDALGMEDIDYLEYAQETIVRSRSVFKAISEQSLKIREWQRIEQMWLLDPPQVL